MSVQKPIKCQSYSTDFKLLRSKNVLFQRQPMIISHSCGFGNVVLPFILKGKHLQIKDGVLEGKV